MDDSQAAQPTRANSPHRHSGSVSSGDPNDLLNLVRRIGAVAPEKIAESLRTEVPLPSLHSSKFAPVPEPTIKTGVTGLTAVAPYLLGEK